MLTVKSTVFVGPNRIWLAIILSQGSLCDVSVVANHLHHTDSAFLWTVLLLFIVTRWLPLQESNSNNITTIGRVA